MIGFFGIIIKKTKAKKVAKKIQIFVFVDSEYIHCTQIFFQCINARKKINVWGDREFHALSESVIAF